MICSEEKDAAKKSKGAFFSGISSEEEFPGAPVHPADGRPVAIYSKKFSSSPYNEDKIYYTNKRAALYKTEMCRSYTELGWCKYAEHCQFCHSEAELRVVTRHPKYKTEICRTFWIEGSCPYGKRCCFAHQENPSLVARAKQLGSRSPGWACRTAEVAPFHLEFNDNLVSDAGDGGAKLGGQAHPAVEYADGDAAARASTYLQQAAVNDALLYTKDTINQIIGAQRGASECYYNLPAHGKYKWQQGAGLSPSATSRSPALLGPRDGDSCVVDGRYSGLFEPMIEDLEGILYTPYRSVWETNRVAVWQADPLNFIPDDPV
ncbi:hypothetical protein PAPHI01_0075 [Pancytospora philotis]|nr:hypothetical protein PAPHI01_0075 [Pancytospora philotis]